MTKDKNWYQMLQSKIDDILNKSLEWEYLKASKFQYHYLLPKYLSGQFFF